MHHTPPPPAPAPTTAPTTSASTAAPSSASEAELTEEDDAFIVEGETRDANQTMVYDPQVVLASGCLGYCPGNVTEQLSDIVVEEGPPRPIPALTRASHTSCLTCA